MACKNLKESCLLFPEQWRVWSKVLTSRFPGPGVHFMCPEGVLGSTAVFDDPPFEKCFAKMVLSAKRNFDF